MTAAHRRPSKDGAWIAGWDASFNKTPNPYKRSDFRKAFERGREAGFRSTDFDIESLRRKLAGRHRND
jgi:hypothetical protein